MSVHDIEVLDIHQQPVKLSQYAGKTLLIVNVASKCGLTPQYEGLEKLYRAFAPMGLVVLGFPCNQFLEQEPGSEDEIATFCATTYDVTFPLFAKIEVNGPGTHPLYKELKAQAPGAPVPEDSDDRLWSFLRAKLPENLKPESIRWNFTKFLVGADGKVIKRYEPNVTPDQIATELADRL